MTEAVAEARLREEVRALAHRLHAAGHHDLGVPGLDRGGSQHDRLESRPADTVDGRGRHGLGKPRSESGLPSRSLSGSCLEHLAHVDLVDRVGRDVRALHRGPDRDRPEVRRGHPRERATEAPDGRAGSRDEIDVAVGIGHDGGMLHPGTMPTVSVESQRPSCLVTGGSSGIGWAVAERLRDEGWQVTSLSRRATAPEGVTALAGDASSDADLASAVAEAAGPHGRLAGLVCAAGVPPSGPWDDRDRWDETIRVDLTAAWQASRAAWDALARARGSIVLVGSIIGAAEGSARSPAYAAAKAGLEGLARSLALIGARGRIRVNVVAPGAIDTPFDVALFPPDARPDVPLGRMGRPEEVAAVASFLLSEAASYVSGASWRVDGGRTALSPTAAARRSSDPRATRT